MKPSRRRQGRQRSHRCHWSYWRYWSCRSKCFFTCSSTTNGISLYCDISRMLVSLVLLALAETTVLLVPREPRATRVPLVLPETTASQEQTALLGESMRLRKCLLISDHAFPLLQTNWFGWCHRRQGSHRFADILLIRRPSCHSHAMVLSIGAKGSAGANGV